MMPRKRPVRLTGLLAIVGLFGLDFAAWSWFADASFFAFLGLVGLLGWIAAFHVPGPWDVVLLAVLGTLTAGIVAGLIASG